MWARCHLKCWTVQCSQSPTVILLLMNSNCVAFIASAKRFFAFHFVFSFFFKYIGFGLVPGISSLTAITINVRVFQCALQMATTTMTAMHCVAKIMFLRLDIRSPDHWSRACTTANVVRRIYRRWFNLPHLIRNSRYHERIKPEIQLNSIYYLLNSCFVLPVVGNFAAFFSATHFSCVCVRADDLLVQRSTCSVRCSKQMTI